MALEEYFDFLSENEIRIKGHRVGIEDVLYEHIYNELTPTELTARFPSLNAEQIYAAILYYLQNRERMDAYLSAWLAHGRQMQEAQAKNPTEAMLKLRRSKAKLLNPANSESNEALLQSIAASMKANTFQDDPSRYSREELHERGRH